jgi:mono/diheme cytochrome c family protein
MKHLVNKIFGLGFIAVSVMSCTSGGENPGIEYAPDMYVSKGYEPFSQLGKKELNPHGMTMRMPVAGTVARGQMSYIYPFANTAEGYEASAGNMNRVPATKANIAEGEALYLTYCWNCHGKKGANDGPVIAGGKFPPPPWANYQSEYIQTLPEGKIYHTITHGKGLMGSHASVLSPNERWKVISYVKQLSLGSKFVYAPDATTEVEATPVPADTANVPTASVKNNNHN